MQDNEPPGDCSYITFYTLVDDAATSAPNTLSSQAFPQQQHEEEVSGSSASTGKLTSGKTAGKLHL
jgi:hypothetical protein